MKYVLLIIILVAGINAFSQAENINQPEFSQLSKLAADDQISQEFKDNYAKGSMYYNLAVDELMNLSSGATEEEIKQSNAKSKQHFKSALPYFEKCNSLSANHEQVTIGIAGCQFALGMVNTKK